jgi:Right handed beta helix region
MDSVGKSAMKTHSSIFSAVLACLVIVTLVAPPQATANVQYTYYASPAGSGSACSLASPCSLTQVQAAVRAVNANMAGDIQVVLRGGEYYLSSPLTLTESDSGFNGYTVYWLSYPGETPELVGGTPVTGWTVYSGSIYQANVGTGLGFNALYENRTRANKARYPKTGYLMDSNGSGYITNPNYLQAWFTFNGGDLQNWPDMVGGEVVVWGFWNWFSSTLPITAFDYYVHQQVTLSRPPFWGLLDPASYPPPKGNGQNTHDRYFIQNVMSALSVAGEFYYNGTTGYLYYYPRSSPIGSQEIILPRVKNIIELRGSSTSNRVQNIQLQGIRIWGSDFTHSFDSWGDPVHPLSAGTSIHYENNEPTANRWGNIYLTDASNITLRTLEISAAGYNGVEMDQYCQNVSILNSRIHDVGYNGVAINGGVDNETDTQISENNVIQNNDIYNIGQLVGHGAGIHIEQSAYNNVSHNEIHNGPRYGVTIVGSTQGDPPQVDPAINLATHNVISYNNAYNLNNDSFDSGIYYQFAAGAYNQFDHNMAHDSHAGSSNAAYYLDYGAISTTVSNNIGFNPTGLLDNSTNQGQWVTQDGTDAPPPGYPASAGNSFTNNVLSSNSAAWTAAGLDSTQMGLLPTSNPVKPLGPILPVVLSLLLSQSALP